MQKLVAALIILCAALFVSAQSSYDDGGVLVTEDSLLSPSRKQVIFVVAKDILQPTKVAMQIQTNEGIIHQFQSLQFPQGVRRGQIIPIWNGEFSLYKDTPWLYIWVTMSTGTDTYYTNTMFPVGQAEQYKEPLIVSIDETGGYTEAYTITIKGIFDSTLPSLILINNSVFVPIRVTSQAPGIIRFTVGAKTRGQFPPGKYLLTLCQGSHCDTAMGRHR
jgi:hypothetical protein